MGRVRRWLQGETREESSPNIRDEPQATWKQLEPQLKTVAKKYNAQHGRPAVPVLDAADLVAKQNP